MKKSTTKKNLGGRPPKYGPAIIRKTKEYLTGSKDDLSVGEGGRVLLRVNIPKIEGLALFLNVARSTLYEWAKTHKAFSDILERLQAEQAGRLIDNGLSGAYNPTIAKLILGKHGYTEKQEVDHTSGGEPIKGFNYIVPKNDTDAPANP